jgi:2-iminobutanoate/2-iminopropanoate deaminase
MNFSKKYIQNEAGLPQWKNPISHAVVANNMCFVSGQLSVNSEGEFISASIKEEAIRSFANFFAVIEKSGFEKEDVVFVDIAFNDLKNLPIIDQLYSKYFDKNKRPARTIYQVEALPFCGKVKIMGTAVKSV